VPPQELSDDPREAFPLTGSFEITLTASLRPDTKPRGEILTAHERIDYGN